jgi:hypothetical protein
MKHDLRYIDGRWLHLFRCPCGKEKRLSYAEMPHHCDCGRSFDIDRVGT